jgi:hypothetical protein
MKTTANLTRLLSATMATACTVVLLASITQQLNRRLAATPHVVEMARVVVTANAPAAVAAVAGQTAHN